MMLHTYTNSIIMKSLKEFIAENLENPTVQTVQESAEKQVDENSSEKTVIENKEIIEVNK